MFMALLSQGGMRLPLLGVRAGFFHANRYSTQELPVWSQPKVTSLLWEGNCSGSSPSWVRNTLRFGPSCTRRENSNIN